MAPTRRAGESVQARRRLAELIGNPSYEVMPFKRTEEQVLAHVPTSIPITVTATEAKGVGATLDLSARLAGHGYSANPHLPARQIADRAELADIVDRLADAGITKAFVIGGDAAQPGAFPDVISMLRALDEMGRPLTDIGIAGYPEGHANIPQAALDAALEAKAPYASRIVTQMCFHAGTIVDWSRTIAADGVTAQVIVGLPGPVSRQKLIRISAGIGLGQSARFLKKQSNLLWRFFMPGGFDPNKLLRQVAAASADRPSTIAGIRLFTFNEIEGTERWRRQLVDSLPEGWVTGPDQGPT